MDGVQSGEKRKTKNAFKHGSSKIILSAIHVPLCFHQINKYLSIFMESQKYFRGTDVQVSMLEFYIQDIFQNLEQLDQILEQVDT